MRRDRCFDGVDIEVVALGVDIDEDGSGSRATDRTGRREERERSRDDFVPFANVEGLQRDDEGIGAGVAADREPRVAIRSDLFFKTGDFIAEDELLFGEDFFDGRQHFGRHRAKLRDQVNERNGAVRLRLDIRRSQGQCERHLRFLSHPSVFGRSSG